MQVARRPVESQSGAGNGRLSAHGPWREEFFSFFFFCVTPPRRALTFKLRGRMEADGLKQKKAEFLRSKADGSKSNLALARRAFFYS